MKICYVCQRFVKPDHECEVAKEMERKRIAAEQENPNKFGVPFIAMKARPTRTMVP